MNRNNITCAQRARRSARFDKINRGHEQTWDKRSPLHSSIDMNRHCSRYLDDSRRKGWLTPDVMGTD